MRGKMSRVIATDKPFEIRRPHVIGKNDESVRMNIPKSLITAIGYQAGEYMKCYLYDKNKIVIERLAR